MIISFDFDGTLDKPEVQEYAKELIDRGLNVWVITARYDDLQVHNHKIDSTNDDLWAVVDSIGLPKHKVRFTCMVWKFEYLLNTKVLWHLDDSDKELTLLEIYDCETVGIDVTKPDWKERCEELLLKNT